MTLSRCAALVDPSYGPGRSTQGVSGPGAGGIVDPVVALLEPVAVGGDLLAACGQYGL